MTIEKSIGDLSSAVVVDYNNFMTFFDVLKRRNYDIIGPNVQNGAIVYDSMERMNDLPVGWRENQDQGTYRLVKCDNHSLFGFNSTPQSWKRFLFPPTQLLWHSNKKNRTITPIINESKMKKLAFFGMRACDLNAIEILKKVFLGSPYTDTTFQKRIADIFIVAVNCSQAGGTCFCTSMNTGPGVQQGYDIALTEIIEKSRHYFLVSFGTKLGGEIMDEIPHRPADADDIQKANQVIHNTSSQIKRQVDLINIKQILYNNSEHKRWFETGKRCLTCANCTMVCPTCFCTTIEDITDLTGQEAERRKSWDSCFTLDFTYIHGGSIRQSAASRYRQWLTHKFAAWYDQFGTSGCVGCGRCITWCPVGIDIIEEINAIRNTEISEPSKKSTKEI